ncbi:MAG: hypothetical protein ACTHL8_07870 [Burkholderiaceae bacterium]
MRTALAAALRHDSCWPATPLSSQLSTADEIHSVTSSAMPAARPPVSTVASETLLAPIFQVTSSRASRKDGSTPVIHRTTPIHASQETVFSIARTTPDLGNATRITRTVSRISSSDSRIGTASRNTASGRCARMHSVRASHTSPSHNAGNSTPSTMRLPNTIECGLPVGPRSSLGTPQAIGTAASTSISAT